MAGNIAGSWSVGLDAPETDALLSPDLGRAIKQSWGRRLASGAGLASDHHISLEPVASREPRGRVYVADDATPCRTLLAHCALGIFAWGGAQDLLAGSPGVAHCLLPFSASGGVARDESFVRDGCRGSRAGQGVMENDRGLARAQESVDSDVRRAPLRTRGEQCWNIGGIDDCGRNK